MAITSGFTTTLGGSEANTCYLEGTKKDRLSVGLHDFYIPYLPSYVSLLIFRNDEGM